ncbi:MAG: reverse transcriptase domain-containing protein [Gemmataceae bacterium]
MVPSEHQIPTATKLARIAWLSGRDKTKKFGCLMHHFNVESLTACFHELDGRKATGIDRVNKDVYGTMLSDNLERLVERMKQMAYRPGPVREVLIPKEGKPGATRPLGIANFEDKLVQKMTAVILESIYEPTFLDCSYGFRPRRGCHDAIRALHGHLFNQPVETVIDVDLADFFGSIRADVVDALLKERIGDARFLRYIQRLLKSGILRNGELTVGEEGVPQGSPASPILANIVAHYVIDLWFESTVKAHCRGRVAMFRYCDDLVICCQSATDAARVHKALGLRLAKYGLRLNGDKTKLVPFSKARQVRGERQGSFDFLGFSFYLGKSRKGGTIPKLRTSRKRLRSKLKRVTAWARVMRSQVRLSALWKTFVAKIRGHIAYYAVSFNQVGVDLFVSRATLILFKWLNRRGGKRRLTWGKFKQFMRAFPLPAIRIHHSLFTLQPR